MQKVDYVKLISSLMAYITNEQSRAGAIKLLVDLWRDPDAEVRVTSIKMIRFLGENGTKEVLDGFDEKKSGVVNLLKETASLLSHPIYAEKDHLNELLQWFFIQQVNK
jgi:hypothetical protein